MANPLEECNTFRTPLAPLAREYRQNGFRGPGEWIQKVHDRANKDELFEHGKQEAYALGAVLSAELMKRMCATRPTVPPYGVNADRVFKEWHESLTTRTGIRAAFGFVFDEQAHKMAQELEAQTDATDPLASVYQRYKKWMPIMRVDYEPDEDVSTMVADDLSLAAIHGGVGFMSGVLHDIPSVWLRERGEIITPQTHVAIARASYPLVVGMASNHVRVLHAFQKVEKCRAILKTSHELFSLQGRSPRMELSELAVQEVKRQLLHSPESVDTTVGCPGLVVFEQGKDSVIHELWDWMTDVHEMATQL